VREVIARKRASLLTHRAVASLNSRPFSSRRAAPLLWLRSPKPDHRIRACPPPFLFHMAARTQTLSVLPAHPFVCRRAKLALRCAIVSLPRSRSQLVAHAPLHGASPNRAVKRTCRQRRSIQRYHFATTVALAYTASRQAAYLYVGPFFSPVGGGRLDSGNFLGDLL